MPRTLFRCWIRVRGVTDRVLRQFGFIQPIPDPPCEVGEVHGKNKRGKSVIDWGIKHRKFVALWNDRFRRRPQMVMATD
ncbi:hypothetical protein V6Z11_D05G092300 [Gossypium hirsutum]